MLLPLASQSGMESLELRLFGDGRYQGKMLIRSTDATLRDRYGAAGFAVTAAGYALTVSGQL